MYNNIKDILEAATLSKEQGMRTKAFEWSDINLHSRTGRIRIMAICRNYGKIQTTRYGFIIHF